MPITELVDYIRTQTQEGVAAEDIRVALMEAGWAEFDIENALHDVAAGLNPTTPGASIHEDLAQVRGMVAHLASRIKSVEIRLASIATLPVQAQLPTAFIAPDHELAAPERRPGVLSKALSLAVVAAVAVFLGVYATELVRRNALAPMDHISIAAVFGAVLLIAAVVTMRLGRGWTASLFAAFGLTLWATDLFVSWRIYHYIEWMVALGLGVLFVVISLVMGRWIQRLTR